MEKLADLYGVKTKALKQAVKRNISRFPADFMFELSDAELNNWRSQFVTSKLDKMGLRWKPYAFTEQGVAMLSSVLRSEQAIQVNILIMRAFVKIKEALATHKEVSRKLKELEGRVDKNDSQIIAIFDAIRQMIALPEKPARKMGFRGGNE